MTPTCEGDSTGSLARAGPPRAAGGARAAAGPHAGRRGARAAGGRGRDRGGGRAGRRDGLGRADVCAAAAAGAVRGPCLTCGLTLPCLTQSRRRFYCRSSWRCARPTPRLRAPCASGRPGRPAGSPCHSTPALRRLCGIPGRCLGGGLCGSGPSSWEKRFAVFPSSTRSCGLCIAARTQCQARTVKCQTAGRRAAGCLPPRPDAGRAGHRAG
jgi:hypothetical protein